MTTLDPAYCADGCGRLAETERPMGASGAGEAYGYDDGEGYLHVELVCAHCAHTTAPALGEHSSNPREDG